MLRIRGKLATLVDFAEDANTCSVQLYSNAHTQLDLTHLLWTLTVSLINADPMKGRYGDKPRIIEILTAAKEPLPTRRVVQLVVGNPGKPVGASALKQDWLRIAACLHYLHSEGILVMSNVRVNQYRQQFWAIAERAIEFWPSGVPIQSGMHLDSHHVFASLRSTAANPLTAHEIACAMKREGKGGSIELQILRNRVEKCLKCHQRRKTVVRVPLPERGKNIGGWLLPEHLPAYKAAVRQLNDALVGISASSSYSYPDTPRIFALLRAAINPPTGREITYILSKLKDNRRIKFICLYQRVLRWLKHHEKQGTIIAVPLPERDVRLRGWRIAEETSAHARESANRKRGR